MFISLQNQRSFPLAMSLMPLRSLTQINQEEKVIHRAK